MAPPARPVKRACDSCHRRKVRGLLLFDRSRLTKVRYNATGKRHNVIGASTMVSLAPSTVYS